MSATGTEIRVRQAPTATRAFVIAALILTALAAGIAIRRETVSSTATTRSATLESVIPTTWLDGTPAVRTQVMLKMNELSFATPWLETSSVGRAVMRHMNELSAPEPASPAAATVHVIRQLTELSPRSGS